jgi:hypothetical protein
MGAPRAKGQTLPPPRITTLVQQHAAAGRGQLVTIQGFHLFVRDATTVNATTVTLTPLLGGSPTSCVSVFNAPSSGNELYVRLGVFESPNPPGCSKSTPSTVAPGLYRVTVTTPGGTSNAVPLVVARPPATPIPRKLLYCSTSPCSPRTTFRPGDVMGILAYGTDSVGATAVFLQGTTAMPVPTHITFIPSGPAERGVVNAFMVPAGLSPGPALVRLRTQLAAIGGGSPDPADRSDLSFALVFAVAAPSSPSSDLPR